MKDRVIQLLLSIILTVVGLIIGLIFAVEEPPYVGESYAILFVGLFNALWLIPYGIYYIRLGKIRNLWLSTCVYIAFVFPVLVTDFIIDLLTLNNGKQS